MNASVPKRLVVIQSFTGFNFIAGYDHFVNCLLQSHLYSKKTMINCCSLREWSEQVKKELCLIAYAPAADLGNLTVFKRK